MMDRYPVQWWKKELREIEDEDLDGVARAFDPGKIDMSVRQMTIGDLVERLRAKEIDMEPDFQRHQDLWSKTSQSRLIESLMLGMPLPSFYFSQETACAENVGSRLVWRVVDGLQRLSSIRNFLLGTMRLTGLEYLGQFNGTSFDELPPTFRRMIVEAPVVVILIRSGTPEEIKFSLFKRLNTGGIPLNQQELRHALMHGRGTDFIASLAQMPQFAKVTNGRVSPRRMLDRELANRFLAFFILDPEESYASMEVFLNDAIRVVNRAGDGTLMRIRKSFGAALGIIHDLMGDRAFVRYLPVQRKWQTQINKALFETLTVGVARLAPQRRRKLREFSSARFMKEYKTLFDCPEQDVDSFLSCVSVSTGDRRKVLRRHSIMGGFLRRITEN